MQQVEIQSQGVSKCNNCHFGRLPFWQEANLAHAHAHSLYSPLARGSTRVSNALAAVLAECRFGRVPFWQATNVLALVAP